MAFRKCPICELNYIKEGETCCSICMRERQKVGKRNDHLEICPVCGVNIVQAGHELCSQCELEHKTMLGHTEDEIIDDSDGSILADIDEVDDNLDGLEIEILDEDHQEEEYNEE